MLHLKLKKHTHQWTTYLSTEIDIPYFWGYFDGFFFLKMRFYQFLTFKKPKLMFDFGRILRALLEKM